jgi:hypothetical protein
MGRVGQLEPLGTLALEAGRGVLALVLAAAVVDGALVHVALVLGLVGRVRAVWRAIAHAVQRDAVEARVARKLSPGVARDLAAAAVLVDQFVRVDSALTVDE